MLINGEANDVFIFSFFQQKFETTMGRLFRHQKKSFRKAATADLSEIERSRSCSKTSNSKNSDVRSPKNIEVTNSFSINRMSLEEKKKKLKIYPTLVIQPIQRTMEKLLTMGKCKSLYQRPQRRYDKFSFYRHQQ